MRALIFNTRRPQFADRAVREALGYALDFEWMNRTLFHGAYRRTASYYPNSELAASGPPSPAELAVLEPLRGNLPPEVFGPAYVPPVTDGSGPTGLRGNLRKAQELLAKAGWTVRDGLLRNAQGAALEFEILLVSSATRRWRWNSRGRFSELGSRPGCGRWTARSIRRGLKSFDFDMTLNRWTSTLSPGNEQIYYWGSEAADWQGSRNYAGIRSPAVDALAESLRRRWTGTIWSPASGRSTGR